MKTTILCSTAFVVSATMAFAGGHLPEQAKVGAFANDVTKAAQGDDDTPGASDAAGISKGGWGNGTPNGPATDDEDE